MSIDAEQKIMRLLRVCPEGAVVTSHYLTTHWDYTSQNLARYVDSGWLKSLGKGAYLRPLSNPLKASFEPFYGALHALQVDNRLVLVGGLSALELHGLAHYLQQTKKPTHHLFAFGGERLPPWFEKYTVTIGVKLAFHAKTLFKSKASESLDWMTSSKDWGAFVTKLSCPERAMLEVLSLVPQVHSLEHAGLLMEGLRNLRPKVIMDLLKSCTSAKAKRLFLALAEQYSLPWVSRLNSSELDLGSGVFILEKGVGYNQKYKISVTKKNTET